MAPSSAAASLRENTSKTSAPRCGASGGLLLARYAEEEQPFLSKPRIQFIKPYTEYDHLARRKEWADEVGDE